MPLVQDLWDFESYNLHFVLFGHKDIQIYNLGIAFLKSVNLYKVYMLSCLCLNVIDFSFFVCLRLNVHVNNFSSILGRLPGLNQY